MPWTPALSRLTSRTHISIFNANQHKRYVAILANLTDKGTGRFEGNLSELKVCL